MDFERDAQKVNLTVSTASTVSTVSTPHTVTPRGLGFQNSANDRDLRRVCTPAPSASLSQYISFFQAYSFENLTSSGFIVDDTLDAAHTKAYASDTAEAGRNRTISRSSPKPRSAPNNPTTDMSHVPMSQRPMATPRTDTSPDPARKFRERHAQAQRSAEEHRDNRIASNSHGRGKAARVSRQLPHVQSKPASNPANKHDEKEPTTPPAPKARPTPSPRTSALNLNRIMEDRSKQTQ